MSSPRKHVGLLFGSFNPVHTGHISIAEHMLSHEGLDEIWFVVSPRNPLKERNMLIGSQQRLEMVRLATGSNPKFKVSDVEFFMPEPSYTCDTLRLIESKHPEIRFFLIIGSDNLKDFHLWKNYEIILSTYPILVYLRSGAEQTPFGNYPGIKLTTAPLLEISSTQIRESIHDDEMLYRLVPAAVADYIRQNKLYGFRLD